MSAIYISIFAVLGALSRYYLGYWIQKLYPDFPAGTLLVNTMGSFFLALFMSLSLSRLVISPEMRTGIAVGFFGSFTTFSTFSYESFMLMSQGDYIRATLYVMLSVFLGIVSALLGFRIGEML